MTAVTEHEQAEITRFGMFDEEVFAEIAGAEDIPVVCWVESSAGKCGSRANAWCRCVECGRFCGYLCQHHVIVLRGSGRPTRHTCGADGDYDDVIEVVPL